VASIPGPAETNDLYASIYNCVMDCDLNNCRKLALDACKSISSSISTSMVAEEGWFMTIRREKFDEVQSGNYRRHTITRRRSVFLRGICLWMSNDGFQSHTKSGKNRRHDIRTDDLPCLALRPFFPIGPCLTQQDVERGFMHVGIPCGRKHLLQDAPTAHQLELPDEGQRGADADPDQAQYLIRHERRGLLAQKEEADSGQREKARELGEEGGLR
jgi:hypothetical protein